MYLYSGTVRPQNKTVTWPFMFQGDAFLEHWQFLKTNPTHGLPVGIANCSIIYSFGNFSWREGFRVGISKRINRIDTYIQRKVILKPTNADENKTEVLPRAVSHNLCNFVMHALHCHLHKRLLHFSPTLSPMSARPNQNSLSFRTAR